MVYFKIVKMIIYKLNLVVRAEIESLFWRSSIKYIILKCNVIVTFYQYIAALLHIKVDEIRISDIQNISIYQYAKTPLGFQSLYIAGHHIVHINSTVIKTDKDSPIRTLVFQINIV